MTRRERVKKVFKVIFAIFGALLYVVCFLFGAVFMFVSALTKDSGKGRRKRAGVMCGPGGKSTWHTKKRSW